MARAAWADPDDGVWEVRTRRNFVHSGEGGSPPIARKMAADRASVLARVLRQMRDDIHEEVP